MANRRNPRRMRLAALSNGRIESSSRARRTFPHQLTPPPPSAMELPPRALAASARYQRLILH